MSGGSPCARPWIGREDGQATIFVVLALAIFVLGLVGFAVDMTNLWFHRQTAQGAADAACQAGVMNLLIPTSTQGFDPQFDIANCGTIPAATPCAYARLNGYDSLNGNRVSVSFALESRFPALLRPRVPRPRTPSFASMWRTTSRSLLPH